MYVFVFLLSIKWFPKQGMLKLKIKHVTGVYKCNHRQSVKLNAYKDRLNDFQCTNITNKGSLNQLHCGNKRPTKGIKHNTGDKL